MAEGGVGEERVGEWKGGRGEVEGPVKVAVAVRLARPSFSVVPAVAALGSASKWAAASFALLQRGEWFEQQPLSSSPACIRRVFLFLNSAASRAGCLYWTASSEVREEKVGQSLALHTLTEVWTGAKALKVWEGRRGTAEQLSAGSCLSLMSKREKSCMHLAYAGAGGKGGAGEGERVVKGWVQALRTVLREVGATVKGRAEQLPSQPARDGPRAPPAEVTAASPVPSPSPPPPPPPPSSTPALSAAVVALVAPLLRPLSDVAADIDRAVPHLPVPID